MKFLRSQSFPVLTILLAAVASLLFEACSSTKSAVGGGLLTDVTGEFSRRDTIDIPLSGVSPATVACFPVHISFSSSEALLAGEANGLRATVLLKFSPIVSWTEERYYTLNDQAALDTLTFTPVSVVTDSSSQLRLTYYGHVADSSFCAVQTRLVVSSWKEEDSVMTALPAMNAPPFSPVRVDTTASGSVVYLPFAPASLTQLIADSVSLAVETTSGSSMVRFLSKEGATTYSPQLTLWIKANVTSKRPEIAAHDTLIGLTLRPIHDCYRLQRLVPAPAPSAGSLRISAGDAWRGYVRFDRFPIPGVSDSSGVVRARATANSAHLQLILGPDGGGSFKRDSAAILIYPLTKPFDPDSARAGLLNFGTGRLYGVGFNTAETRAAPDVRVFEIADLINQWWVNPSSNNGLLISLSGEAQLVDALEIRSMRLIVTTTMPPQLIGKPASGEAPR